MSAQPVENVQVIVGPARHYPLPAPAGADLSRAINTRRRRKCIAEGAHPEVIGVKCERCGL
jgi:hypothetical protein